MDGTAKEVTAYYCSGTLKQRIADALEATGIAPTVESLGPLDEFHLGGRPATVHLINQLDIGPADRVLDVGSGLGGTARYMASKTRAAILGVDLTAEYVEVATWLTGLVGLGDSVIFEQRSATDLDAVDAFSYATMVHVGMNIADKAGLCERISTLLKPRGTFAIYDIMATSETEPDYPVPWAASSATSELETAVAYTGYLEAAGFEVVSLDDRTDAALAAFELQAKVATGSSGPPGLGLHLVMGPDTRTKIGNLKSAVTQGLVAPTEIIARLA